MPRCLVRMDGVTFLTDPMFSERASPVSFAGPEATGRARRAARCTAAARLRDHLARPLRPHRPAVDRGAGSARRAVLRAARARRARPRGRREGHRARLVAGGDASACVRIICVPAQHFSGRSLSDGNQRLWAGWVVEGPTRRFYHAGDTGYFDGFRDIGERFGPIDLAALPIGAYDPASIMQFVHMNPEEAMQAAIDLRATTARGHALRHLRSDRRAAGRAAAALSRRSQQPRTGAGRQRGR